MSGCYEYYEYNDCGDYNDYCYRPPRRRHVRYTETWDYSY